MFSLASVCFFVCLFVCLSSAGLRNLTTQPIFAKFVVKAARWPLDFGINPEEIVTARVRVRWAESTTVLGMSGCVLPSVCFIATILRHHAAAWVEVCALSAIRVLIFVFSNYLADYRCLHCLL